MYRGRFVNKLFKNIVLGSRINTGVHKKIKKIQYFLLKCLYLNKYNAKKRKNQEKDGIYLQSIFYIKWKILTRSLYYRWK